MHKATSQKQNPEEAAEGKKITEAIATLKYELQHNRKLAYVEGMHFVPSRADEVDWQSFARRWPT
jgi:hypothetical protein